MKAEQEIRDLREKLIKDRDTLSAQLNVVLGAIQTCDLVLSNENKTPTEDKPVEEKA
jgi:hypothetical protein